MTSLHKFLQALDSRSLAAYILNHSYNTNSSVTVTSGDIIPDVLKAAIQVIESVITLEAVKFSNGSLQLLIDPEYKKRNNLSDVMSLIHNRPANTSTPKPNCQINKTDLYERARVNGWTQKLESEKLLAANTNKKV